MSAVLSLANISIGSLRIANLTLLLPIAPAVDRPVDISSDILDAELNSDGGTATVVPDVTITPSPSIVPTLMPTIGISDTITLTDTTTLTDTMLLTDTTILTDTTTLTDTTPLPDTTTIATPAPATVATPVPVVPTVIANITEVSIPTVSVKTRKYFVEAGDTLLLIASKFNVTVQQIEDVNPYLQNPDNLIVGQELDIP